MPSPRGGVWLLMFLAPPAAAGVSCRELTRGAIRLATASLLLITALGVVHGPRPNRDRQLVAAAIQRAGGQAILAEDLLAEDVALQGGRLWVANPIDAFDHRDQGLYLDWLVGRPAGDRAISHARVVLVARYSRAQHRLDSDSRATVIACTESAIAYSVAG